MTRANINYIGEWQGEYPNRYQPMLWFYHNGDQYPTGIRDSYNLMDFLNSDRTEQDFKDWATKNYEGVELEEIDQPKVYYTGSFITDYSYVFDPGMDSYMVWNWGHLEFEGNLEKFKLWLQEQGDE